MPAVQKPRISPGPLRESARFIDDVSDLEGRVDLPFFTKLLVELFQAADCLFIQGYHDPNFLSELRDKFLMDNNYPKYIIAFFLRKEKRAISSANCRRNREEMLSLAQKWFFQTGRIFRGGE